MTLTIYISSATDGYFLVKAKELPDLAAKATSIQGIPDAARAAADPSQSSANGGMPTDKYGNPLGGPAGRNKLIGHYVPQLTACVVDNSVAVIPGGPEICAHLGIPSLEQ